MKVSTLFFVLQATIPAYLMLASATSMGDDLRDFGSPYDEDERLPQFGRHIAEDGVRYPSDHSIKDRLQYSGNFRETQDATGSSDRSKLDDRSKSDPFDDRYDLSDPLDEDGEIYGKDSLGDEEEEEKDIDPYSEGRPFYRRSLNTNYLKD
ncbi:hypothetical protein IWQ61_010167 [Dispira simplex]|nr:hypothetical protein IWQ61_010167 [Dispira simplex]